MSNEITEFHNEFFQEIVASADADGTWTEDSFFERFCEYLVDAGELETADRSPYCPATGGIRVDGYGGDPAMAEGVLSLIVADFNQSQTVETLTATEMNATFKRVSNFLSKVFQPRFRESLEEVDPAFGLSDLIVKRWGQVSKVRLFLITNRLLSTRVDGRASEEFNGIPVTYSVWDIGRLQRFAASGRVREEIIIDLEKEFGAGMPALPAHLTKAGYEAYLVVFPGKQLASIYDRWGARLLEQNVRVFLQARGTVNKGIRNTLENEPAMFFAYNNGVTATAEHVEVKKDGSGILLTKLRNLQIVNGGQTTASIHQASLKKDVDLSNVFVQMKLSIVQPSQALEVVPKISEYANSQNKVNAADFFANHPFHVRMEEFSRRIYAPSADGSFRESKWFYERARGQYLDARGLLTETNRKKFDVEYPKNQLISKTDLAKFLNPWLGQPDTVCKGSQKNFAEFAREIGRAWLKGSDVFNEAYYREAIAKAIVFRQMEKLVSEQPWYQGGGLRSRVVPYVIAKYAFDIADSGGHVDFDQIWRNQKISETLERSITVASEPVYDVIVNSGALSTNPLEWSKQQACWERVKALKINWPHDWLDCTLSSEEFKRNTKDAVQDQRILQGIFAQTAVVQAGGTFWKEVKSWGIQKKLLTPKEAGVLDVAAAIPNAIPSEKQCAVIVATLNKLREEGCQLVLELPA